MGGNQCGGLRPAKEGGILINGPEPKSSEAFTERRAALRLQGDGTISGDLQVVYSGREALQRRLDARDDDETTRRRTWRRSARPGWFPVPGSPWPVPMDGKALRRR